jgi:serine protease Do
VILSVNGRSVETSTELPTIVARMKPGTNVELAVWRGRKEQKIQLRTDELQPDEEQSRAANRASGEPDADEASRLGISVRQLTAQEKQRVKTEGTLVVQEVSGPAADAGVQPGDIILGVNGKRVKSVDELQEVAKTAGKSVALLIQRDDAQLFIPLRPN